MEDVRKGDMVILHGRALIDGLQESPATVVGISGGDKVSCTIDRGNGGKPFDVPGIAIYGPTSDQSNWWDWPKDEAGQPVRPEREPEGGEPAAEPPLSSDADTLKSQE